MRQGNKIFVFVNSMQHLPILLIFFDSFHYSAIMVNPLLKKRDQVGNCTIKSNFAVAVQKLILLVVVT